MIHDDSSKNAVFLDNDTNNQSAATLSAARFLLTSSPLVGTRPIACGTLKPRKKFLGLSTQQSTSSEINVFLEVMTTRSTQTRGR